MVAKSRRIAIRALIVLAIGSIMVAVGLAIHAGNLPVYIGLDISGAQSGQPPVLVLREGAADQNTRIPMERVQWPAKTLQNGETFRSDPETFTRYYASISRSNYEAAVIEIGNQSSANLRRLYIGTWIPRIYGPGNPLIPERVGKHYLRLPSPIEGGQLNLPPIPFWERGGLGTIIVLAPLLFVACIVVLACGWYLLRMLPRIAVLPPPIGYALHSPSWKVLAGLCIAPAIVFMIYWLLYYPAILHGDPHHQLRQYLDGAIRNNHPVLSTLWIGVLWSLTENWVGNVLVQIVALSAIVGYSFYLLYRLNVPPIVLYLVYAVTLLSPRIAVHAVTVWKDVPYSVLCGLLTILLLLYFVTSNVRRQWGYWVAIGIVLGLIPLFRHNGLAVFLSVPILMCICCFRHIRFVSVSIAIAAAIFLVFRYVVIPPVTAQSETGLDFWTIRNSKSTIRGILEQDPPISSEEMELMHKSGIVEAIDWVWFFDNGTFPPWSAARMRMVVQNTRGNERFDAVREFEQRLISSYPLIRWQAYLIKDRIGRAKYLFWKSEREEIRLGVYVPHNLRESVDSSLLKQLHNLLVRLTDKRNIFLSQPVIHFYLVMIALCIVVARHRDVRYGLVFAPALLNSIALVVVGAGTSDRYHFPLELMTGFLCCLALLPSPDESETHDRLAKKKSRKN